MNAFLILEIKENSSKAEIKKAYRRLANKYHPDKEGGSLEQFKLVKEAYEFLIKGISSTKAFVKEPKKPRAKTVDPQQDPEPYSFNYKYEPIPFISLSIPLAHSFLGGDVRIPNTNYYFSLKPGTEHGSQERITATTFDNFNKAVWDIKFQLFDIKKRFEIVYADGDFRLNYKLKVSIAMLLAERPIEIPNPNDSQESIFINLPLQDHIIKKTQKQSFSINQDKWFKILGAGLYKDGIRDPLYIEPEIIFSPLSSENPNVIFALRDKVNKMKIPTGTDDSSDYFSAWCNGSKFY